MLGLRLLTIHNLHAVNRFMSEMRSAIADGTFGEWKDSLPRAG
jgi:tRNA-guanine family transglycosylase